MQLRELSRTVRRALGFRTRPATARATAAELNRAYYQAHHEAAGKYQQNNWLVSEIDAILSVRPSSILEIGCGNGRFLAAIKPHVERVTGVDWARSPVADQLGVAGHVLLLDITKDPLPSADLVCSADVLEHIAPDALRPTLKRLHEAGREHYHVIACYDDNHSHLSIMAPDEWLAMFKALSGRYRLIDVRTRKGRQGEKKPICVVATFDPTGRDRA